MKSSLFKKTIGLILAFLMLFCGISFNIKGISAVKAYAVEANTLGECVKFPTVEYSYNGKTYYTTPYYRIKTRFGRHLFDVPISCTNATEANDYFGLSQYRFEETVKNSGIYRIYNRLSGGCLRAEYYNNGNLVSKSGYPLIDGITGDEFRVYQNDDCTYSIVDISGKKYLHWRLIDFKVSEYNSIGDDRKLLLEPVDENSYISPYANRNQNIQRNEYLSSGKSGGSSWIGTLKTSNNIYRSVWNLAETGAKLADNKTVEKIFKCCGAAGAGLSIGLDIYSLTQPSESEKIEAMINQKISVLQQEIKSIQDSSQNNLGLNMYGGMINKEKSTSLPKYSEYLTSIKNGDLAFPKDAARITNLARKASELKQSYIDILDLVTFINQSDENILLNNEHALWNVYDKYFECLDNLISMSEEYRYIDTLATKTSPQQIDSIKSLIATDKSILESYIVNYERMRNILVEKTTTMDHANKHINNPSDSTPMAIDDYSYTVLNTTPRYYPLRDSPFKAAKLKAFKCELEFIIPKADILRDKIKNYEDRVYETCKALVSDNIDVYKALADRFNKPKTIVKEAENQILSKAANYSTAVQNYSGTGYVTGFQNNDTSIGFKETTGESGYYKLKLRYSAGNGDAKNIEIKVNDYLYKVICPKTTDWNTWAEAEVYVLLHEGDNSITCFADADSQNYINLDSITITKEQPSTLPRDGMMLSWEAENLPAMVGVVEGDGRKATVNTSQNHMSYGPYTDRVPAGNNTAAYKLKIDDITGTDNEVVIIDVNDYATQQIIAHKTIYRKDFARANAYQMFYLPFVSPASSCLEFRVWYIGNAEIKLDYVGVTHSREGMLNAWEAENLPREIGEVDADGVKAKVGDPEYCLSFGPYTNIVSGGSNVAAYRLKIDDNTSGLDDYVAVIDVCECEYGGIITQRTLFRKDFVKANEYQTFYLPYKYPMSGPRNGLEFRVRYKGHAIIKLDCVGIGVDGVNGPTKHMEAEDAVNLGGAIKDTLHAGYSGSGFVAGYYIKDAQTTFSVNAASSGTYNLKLQYSAGNGDSNNIGLYINGTKIKNIVFQRTANWTTWASKNECVILKRGENIIDLKSESNAGCINLDYLDMTKCFEAENAILSGGASINTNHTGYSGSGFVDQFNAGAQAAFEINTTSAGIYELALDYSAGFSDCANIGLYVNGSKWKNITFKKTTNWDTWEKQTDCVILQSGVNVITYRAESNLTGCINLDYLNVINMAYQAEDAVLSGNATKDITHTGYGGSGFVSGFCYVGSRATFTVDTNINGAYNLYLGYSAGSSDCTNIGLYINGTKIKDISFSKTANWDTWATKNEYVILQKGENKIELVSEPNLNGAINLDYLYLVRCIPLS